MNRTTNNQRPADPKNPSGNGEARAVDHSGAPFLPAESILQHPNLRRFPHQAMATVFEIFIFHADGTYSHQAAQEAFRIADTIESEISRFIPNSDIGRINALDPGESTCVGIHAFACLAHGLKLGRETGGCFDIFIGSLKDEWAGRKSKRHALIPRRRDDGRRAAGQCPLELNEAAFEVRMSERSVVDLGAYGKGYAVDRMAESLREWDIESALVHAGRSSVHAFGRLPDGSGWPVTVSHPLDRRKILHRFELLDRAMGASGLEKGAHIFDPRTGEPARERIAAWVLAPDAATADALSTAFMVMEGDAVRAYCSARPEIQAMVMTGAEWGGRLITFGVPALTEKEKT
jgi:thiamine biosynthesis lipoprotein